MEDSSLPRPLQFAAAPATPEPLPALEPTPQPAPEGPKKPSGSWRGAFWMVLVGAAVGAGLWLALDGAAVTGPAASGPALKTAVVDVGPLNQTLRVAGTVQARNYASITAPRMRGPRDSGSSELTLMELAEPGNMVKAGDVVARFELKWLEDHIDDRASVLTQSQAEVEKRRAEIMILRETDRQGEVNAKAEYDKAELDLRTAEVRSDIEAEVLANLAQQAEVSWKQLQFANEIKEEAHSADLEQFKIQVVEDRLHLERHERDYEKMAVVTPISGLVVMETMFKREIGGFGQTEEGDRVYPGSLFMRVVDTSEMIVSADVNQVDIQGVRMGQKANIRLDAYPDLVLEGRIVSIGAIAGSGGGGRSRFSRGSSGLFLKSVPIEIAIDTSDERVIPDLSASADILIGDEGEGVLVPREALRSGDEGSFVWVRRGDRFERRAVETGSVNDTHAMVVSGVEQGEEVLLGDRPPPQA